MVHTQGHFTHVLNMSTPKTHGSNTRPYASRLGQIESILTPAAL